MGKGNIAKANMARERKAAQAAAEGKASSAEDRKKHEQSKAQIQCNICMQGFPSTVRAPELQQHLDARHEKLKKTIPEVFPTFTGTTF